MSEMPGFRPELPPSRAMLFEHLFPGNRWDKLPKVHPLNVVPLIDHLLIGGDQVDRDLGKAVGSGMGFAHRIEIDRPDQMTLAVNLLDTIPIKERANRGWINDLIDIDERIGGVGLRHVAWPNPDVMSNGIAGVVAAEIHSGLPLYKSTDALLIGIMKPDGKPSGLITYIKGERIKGLREPQKAKIFLGLGRPALQEIGVRS